MDQLLWGMLQSGFFKNLAAFIHWIIHRLSKSWDGGSENFSVSFGHLTFPRMQFWRSSHICRASLALCDQSGVPRGPQWHLYFLLDQLPQRDPESLSRPFWRSKNYFNKIVDLRQTDAEGFWAKMFCWATTGFMWLEQGAPNIKVSGAELYIGCQLTQFGWTLGLLCRWQWPFLW